MNYKICGYYLDGEQLAIVLDESKYLLVVAGAGSGKTLSILGKINYLVNEKKINKDDILCISFTREASLSLRSKIKHEFDFDMDVYTFHKLGLEVLKEKNLKYDISASDTLENIIHEFLYVFVLSDENYMKIILKYFKIRYKDKNTYLEFLDKNSNQIILFERLLSTFIHLLKCKGYGLSSFKFLLKKARRNIFGYKEQKLFLTIALNIYLQYEKYLDDNKQIDFDDMIIRATNEVEKRGLNKRYKYIIIDEYQDTSLVRFKLIKSILQKTFSNLVVVGDDFQSIYRFTGCDISLFINFSFYFQGAAVKKIENTYRNSQELITVAGNFVMKNRCQIFKNLSSQKHLKKPIKIFYYQDMKKDFIYLLKKIGEINKNPIMILGRNNNDIYRLLSKRDKVFSDGRLFFFGFDNISAYYLTIHKSKGLEEENVIIINLVDDKLGFPNRISDDKILRFVSIKEERYPYAEERRLFYVALTRTKNNVYLFVPKKKASIFVKELIKEHRKMIAIINV